jgi:hypothetical protein
MSGQITGESTGLPKGDKDFIFMYNDRIIETSRLIVTVAFEAGCTPIVFKAACDYGWAEIGVMNIDPVYDCSGAYILNFLVIN